LVTSSRHQGSDNDFEALRAQASDESIRHP